MSCINIAETMNHIHSFVASVLQNREGNSSEGQDQNGDHSDAVAEDNTCVNNANNNNGNNNENDRTSSENNNDINNNINNNNNNNNNDDANTTQNEEIPTSHTIPGHTIPSEQILNEIFIPIYLLSNPEVLYYHLREAKKKAPPASNYVIDHLPIVQITKDDLVDPSNRQCSICFNDISLNQRVIRLIPYCGHTFCSRDCIMPWLRQNNTCPVCRYELPTDAGYDYERQRQQRMACRKPRLAKHELNRLTIPQLKQLLRARYRNTSETPEEQKKIPHIYDKQDLIDYLISCGDEYVDWIAAPDPVRYSVKDLEAMSISQLKHIMNEAGVFFETQKDIVEKTDMLRYFILSGRLEVIDDGDDESRDDVNMDDGSDTDADIATANDHVMEEIVSTKQRNSKQEEGIEVSVVTSKDGVKVETVVSDDEEEEEEMENNVDVGGDGRRVSI